jgi:DNA sulfur modification protein DndE
MKSIKIKYKKIFAYIVFVYVLLFFISLAVCSESKKLADYFQNLPFEMPPIIEPAFPDFQVNITKFGALNDGHTLNTQAFAGAISSCAKLGGGTVIVPPGTWLTGPIKLESNINLHLERGALIQFSKNINDFPFIAGFDGKSKRYIITPPIYGYRLKNIAITGDGIIDGAGEAWRPVKKEKQTSSQWKKLVASGGAVSENGKMWWPSKEAMGTEDFIKKCEQENKKLTLDDYVQTREYFRTHMVQFIQCNGILLDGPTFQNAPKFHVYPIQSENIIVRNIRILAPWYAQNGDGIDFSSCRNVVAYNMMVNAGDDAICIKPGRISDLQKPGPACENIVLADCIVYSGHGGFVIGSESYGGARNISVSNCTFIGTDVGLRFKSLRKRGGLVENVFIDGIQMSGIQDEAILFDMYYGDEDYGATANLTQMKSESVNEFTPRFQNFSIKNIVCDGASQAILITGLPELPIRDIIFQNIFISSDKGISIFNADSIVVKDVDINCNTGSVVSVVQSKNIILEKLRYLKGSEVFLSVNGNKTANIQLTNIDLSFAKKDIEFDTDVDHNVVKVMENASK